MRRAALPLTLLGASELLVAAGGGRASGSPAAGAAFTAPFDRPDVRGVVVVGAG